MNIFDNYQDWRKKKKHESLERRAWGDTMQEFHPAWTKSLNRFMKIHLNPKLTEGEREYYEQKEVNNMQKKRDEIKKRKLRKYGLI